MGLLFVFYYHNMPETQVKKKILIVEDDAFLSSLLKTRIQGDGFEALLASDGDMALKILQEEKPDLVLLDVILPKRSGFELIESLQSDPRFKSVPIVIISNLGQEADIIRGKELGVVDYFVKARISIDDLLKKVREHLK